MNSAIPANARLAAAIAAHRFGSGEASLGNIGLNPAAWLLAQIGPAEAARGDGLLTTAQAIHIVQLESERAYTQRRPRPEASISMK